MQSQHCNYNNNDNDDNVMCASVWFEFLGGLLQCQNLWYMWGKHDNKEEDLNWEQPFPRVFGCKKGSDIKEGNNMKVRVYNS